jgi:hypothetical protein
MFAHTRLYQLSDPRGGVNIDPRDMINISYVQANKAMLCVKFLDSNQKKRFKCVFLYKTY